MTLQTGKNRHGWRRVVTAGLAGGAVAAGVMAGFGAPTAMADPADPTTQTDTPPVMTADEALAIIDRDYDIGAGGGQLSTLIHDVLKLRALGFKPSNANKEAITKALDYRPNQAPLIEALQETLDTSASCRLRCRTRTRASSPGTTSASASRHRAWAPMLPPVCRRTPARLRVRVIPRRRLACGCARRQAAEYPRLPGGSRAAAAGRRRVPLQPPASPRVLHRGFEALVTKFQYVVDQRRELTAAGTHVIVPGDDDGRRSARHHRQGL